MSKHRNTLTLGLILILLMLIGKQCKGVTIDSIRAYIATKDIQHPDIVLAQCILETGHLKCTKCSMDVNNLFGFYYKGRYIRFDTWQQSVDYYEWWQNQLYRGGDYYVFLERIGFATAPNYIKTLKQINYGYK